MVEPEKFGVHATHCCVFHGCKYGDEDCPVVTGKIVQQYECEYCEPYGSFSDTPKIFVSKFDEKKLAYVKYEAKHAISDSPFIVFNKTPVNIEEEPEVFVMERQEFHKYWVSLKEYHGDDS